MSEYLEQQPTRDEVDALTGRVVVAFGTNWCGHCLGAERFIGPALSRDDLTVVRAEDGKGRPLGRSFGVKLWPTLVMLRDGVEVARVVRPTSRQAIEDALAKLDPVPR